MSTFTSQVSGLRRILLFLFLLLVSLSLAFINLPASAMPEDPQNRESDAVSLSEDPGAVKEAQTEQDFVLTEHAQSAAEPIAVAEESQPSAVANESVLIGSQDGRAKWRLDRMANQKYHLIAQLEGADSWTSPDGFVGLRTSGDTDYRYFPYDSAELTDGATTAKAELATSGGSIIDVTDVLTADQGQLRVERSFVVRKVGTDADSGFSLSFALKDVAARKPDTYQWFAPGTWYGNSANDSFTKLNNMAFDGQVTSMGVDNLGAPLVMAYHGDTALTITDRSDGKSETVSADRQAQYNKTIIDGAFRLAGLGVRTSADGGTEIFHSYPAWSKNYRNRYGDKPEINRFLPLTEGLEGTTGIEVTSTESDSFENAISATWRSAYDQMATVTDRFDTQIHFDTLVDYLDDSYGIDGGRPQFMVHYDHHNATSGFLHRNADVAWILLTQGIERGDKEMVKRARTVISDQVENGGLDHVHNPRSTAEAHYSVLRAYVVDKAHGVEQSTWMDKVLSYAGSLPDTPTIYAVPPLVELSRVTGDPAYREAAVRAANAAWEGGHKNVKFFGSLEDYAGGPAEHDREASYLALEAYISLAQSSTDVSEKEKWVGHATTAATIAETWQRIEDLAMVPVDADQSLIMYGNEDIPPSGISVIHAGSNAGDQYGALMTTEFYQLYELTGDEHFRDFAVYLEKNSMLYTNLGDKAGWMADRLKGSGLGFTNEYLGSGANDYWDNNRRGDGHDSNLGWTSYVLAAMTQRTLDLYGTYSLTDPSTSSIGLDAYYSLVNRATGNALAVKDASRTDNAEIAVAQTDPSARTQQWLLENLDGNYKLVNRDSGKVLNLTGGNGKVGASLQQSVFMPTLAYPVSMTESGDGWHTLKINGSDGVVEESGDGVHIATATGIDNQQWKLVPRGDVRLRTPGTANLLTAADDATVFTPLDDHASLAQRWSIIPLDSGYSAVVSRLDGKALTRTASGTHMEVASAVEAHTSSGRTEEGYGLDQQWSLSLNADGTVSLTDRLERGTDVYHLQTAGPATTEAPASITALTASFAVAEVGQGISLPDSVGALWSNGNESQEQVSWTGQPNGSQVGTFHFYGNVSGTQVRAAASVLVLPEGGITKIAPLQVQTRVGIAPVLPQTVSGLDASGRQYVLPVTWNAVQTEDFEVPGEVQIQGTVPGIFLKATAIVKVVDTVTPIISADAPRVITTPGVMPALPSTMTVTVEGGMQEERGVIWEAVAQEEVQNPGYLQVVGHVGDYEVTAYVTVAIFYDDFASGTMDRWSVSPGANYTVNEGVASVAKPSQSQWAFAKSGDNPLVVTDAVIESSIRLNTDQNGGLFIRSSDGDANGYYLGYEGHWTNAVTGKQVNGSWNQWKYADGGASGQGTFHTLRMIAEGDSISEYINGSPNAFYKTTDTSFANGGVGIRSWQAGMSMDYFLVAPVPQEMHTDKAMSTSVAGNVPVLPAVVLATLADGSQINVSVTWDSIDPSSWNSEGIVTVPGVTSQGTSASVEVTVTGLPEVQSVINPLIVTKAGEIPDLPSVLPVVYNDGHKDSKAVFWEVPSDFVPNEGAHTIWGTIEGTDVRAAASVVVASYDIDFTSDCPDGWQTFQGNWTCGDRGYRVSDAGWNGAKAVKTEATGEDLVYQGTIRMDNSGRKQAGLIFRVTNPGNGADNYTGYYVGINADDRSAVLGRAGGSWTELTSTPNIAAAVTDSDITLRVVVSGQRIRLYVEDMLNPVIDYTDTSSAAPRQGTIGVRGYNTSYSVSEAILAPAPQPLGIDKTHVTTVGGVTPRLPGSVTVTDWDGEKASRSVKWDLDGVSFDKQSVTSSGITIKGNVSGTSMQAEAIVTILDAVPTSAVPSEVETTVNVIPSMPETALVKLSNGELAQLPVSQWETVDPSWLSEPGMFEVTGDFGVDLAFRARVIIKVIDAEAPVTIIGISPVTVTTNAGVAPRLPDMVTVSYSDGSTAKKAVQWEAVPAGKYAVGGTAFTVNGSVSGTDILARATVTVVAGSTENPKPGDGNENPSDSDGGNSTDPGGSGSTTENPHAKAGGGLSATGSSILGAIFAAGMLMACGFAFRRFATGNLANGRLFGGRFFGGKGKSPRGK